MWQELRTEQHSVFAQKRCKCFWAHICQSTFAGELSILLCLGKCISNVLLLQKHNQLLAIKIQNTQIVLPFAARKWQTELTFSHFFAIDFSFFKFLALHNNNKTPKSKTSSNFTRKSGFYEIFIFSAQLQYPNHSSNVMSVVWKRKWFTCCHQRLPRSSALLRHSQHSSHKWARHKIKHRKLITCSL